MIDLKIATVVECYNTANLAVKFHYHGVIIEVVVVIIVVIVIIVVVVVVGCVDDVDEELRRQHDGRHHPEDANFRTEMFSRQDLSSTYG